MNSKDDAKYRLKLAEGFLKEARQNFDYRQIRSCVDNSQLAIENGAKAVIICFGPLGKTHNPVNALRRILKQEKLTSEIERLINDLLPLIEGFGEEKHILIDYGDEESYTLPWNLFDENDAREAVERACKVIDLARKVVGKIIGE
ncbi:HEPN domain-containing protein [bacterium]|nr:HEPN domain-containing protein [bacterium]